MLAEPATLEAEQRAHAHRATPAGVAFAVEGGIDPNDLAQAGWGILFAPGVSQEIKDALSPLIEHRRQQASPFRIFDGDDSILPGDTSLTWLSRRGVGLTVVNPDLGVPFYLLLVGPPDTLPFEFQYGLDLYWAVGRLWFDTADEFGRYADSVVRYETATAVQTARQVAIFAPQHDFDQATQLFNRQVAMPLRDGEGARPAPVGSRQKFRLRTYLQADATKANLTRIFAGDIEGGAPALLFSGGHGMAFEPGDPQLFAGQGALVCQDWGGLGSIAPPHWFGGADLDEGSKVHGLIHVLFACYGGGTPTQDNFDRLNGAPKIIAPRPFFSRLPQALLAHPRGGALAVLAHVERAWAYSFQGQKNNSQVQGFRDVLGRLMRGDRIGQATDVFNIRWAALSTMLAEQQLELRHGGQVPMRALGRLWVARDDARNFVILGDPAVRLRVEDMPVLG